jgi:trimeric autotransporter adhesin
VTYAWTSGLDEWFVNEARGIEHGFTIRNKRGASGLSLEVRGDLTAVGGGASITFVDRQGSAQLSYSGLKALDAEGRVLEVRMEIQGARIRLAVDDRTAKYPVTIDPLLQQAYLKPAAVGSSQAGDFFGNAVAVSGDTVVVGAPREASSTLGVNSAPNEAAAFAGAAYIFVRAGSTWSQQAYLKPANVGTSQTNDAFGSSVAISGDTLVIGAPGEASSSLGVKHTQ